MMLESLEYMEFHMLMGVIQIEIFIKLEMPIFKPGSSY